MPVYIAAPISLIPFGLGALLMATAFWLYYRFRQIANMFWSFIALTCFWIAYEYLHQTWDLAFPWMTLGNGFASTHQLVQWYEYTGVYGGTYWILMSNLILFETFLAFKANRATKKRRILILRAAIHILLPVIISLFIYNSYSEVKNPANVVVVQPNINPYDKYGSLTPLDQTRQLINLSDSIAQPNTEYFIWPETAITGELDEGNTFNDKNLMEVKGFLNKYKNGNVISGIESFKIYKTAETTSARLDEKANFYYDVFNAATQVENSPRLQFYHKSKLVPGVEQLPFAQTLSFLKPIFAGFGGSTGGYGRQSKPGVFYSQSGVGVNPVICYESIWGEWVAKSVKEGAQFIAIVTNDGWWGNTSGKDQHFDYARLRAIETRRSIARSANTGISGFIDQRGDVIKKSKWWTPTALKADINLNEKLTVYTLYQDYIAFAGCLGAVIFAIVLLSSVFSKKHRTLNDAKI